MIVHSYARFSDPSQEGGDSLRRQWQAAEDYCEKHGYTLSDLRFTDKGRSGFKGDKQKALNAFLRAVDDGRVQPGETLLVENVDRLSRKGIRQTQNIVNKLLDAGINIAILMPVEKVYKASDRNDIGGAIELAAYAFQAHVYSENLSNRIKSYNGNQRAKRRSGDNVRISSVTPSWLEYSNGKFKKRPDAVKAIKYIYKRTIEGIGRKVLIQELNAKFPPISRRKNSHSWNETFVGGLIKDRKVLGECKSTATGEVFKDYYPAIIPEKTWLKANAESRKRTTERGPSQQKINLFNGLLYHAVDDCTMAFYTSIVKRKAGRVQNHRYRSYKREQGVKGASKETIAVQRFEDLVFNFLPAIELEVRNDDPRSELISSRDYLQSEIDELQKQIGSRSGAGAAVLAPMLADLAEQLEQIEKELAITPAVNTEPTRDYREKLSNMRRGTIDERKRVREGIRAIVNRITVYPIKLGPLRRDPVKSILEIEFKNGQFIRAVELPDNRLIEISGQITTSLADQCKNGLRFNADKYKRISELAVKPK